MNKLIELDLIDLDTAYAYSLEKQNATLIIKVKELEFLLQHLEETEDKLEDKIQECLNYSLRFATMGGIGL